MATDNLSDYKPLQINDADAFNIGIVVSEWNDFVTFNLRDGAIETLLKHGVKRERIKVYYVPGAFELSYAAMRLCARDQYFDAIIAIGCVIRGETSHFDYVCQGVTQGITACNTQTQTPTIFCVLTDDTKEQSIARSGGALGNKGVEAAITALKMVDFKNNI
ncbi:6,7-dimethyl-8-ribityllumazine synthase [Riemerella columbina]|uniref:6,7-dimethyl-8-ribityllumazine synthase n=1 Tax=Riemerella columbina TaxID=103810 RepID=UPI000372B196|nr:6,7-dimethyl-8-ribityllumazine synthase [Riemerella columbina]